MRARGLCISNDNLVKALGMPPNSVIMQTWISPATNDIFISMTSDKFEEIPEHHEMKFYNYYPREGKP